MEIKVPLIQNPTGLGDLISTVTKAVGINPCMSCQERARKLNEALKFTPRWTNPPQPAEGWTTEALVTPAGPENKVVGLYRHTENDSWWMVWEIIGGRYRNSYAYCCGGTPEKSARAKFEELCR